MVAITKVYDIPSMFVKILTIETSQCNCNICLPPVKRISQQ